MRTRLIRLRFRRRLRKGQRQVEDLGTQAEQGLEEHLLKRFEHLAPVRRFVVGWIGLVLLLIAALVGQNVSLSDYYQSIGTIPGGIYSEGIRGRFTNANPMYATSDADASVAKLIFAGLFRQNAEGKLVGDLANDYSTDSHGNTYIVHLKPHLTWQDGQPLTARDVVFTYQAIQNPDAQSPLQSGWQGIQVSAPDARTVIFKLPDSLASFPYNMTNGIVPRHLLARLPAASLRSADFNTVHPVGAGPFAWQAVQVTGDGNPKNAGQQIALTPFQAYNGGAPKLQQFVVHVFASEQPLLAAFKNKQLTGIEGLSERPARLQGKTGVIEHSLPLRAATMVFFKTSAGVLANQSVRQALVEGTDVPTIVHQLDYPARLVREPLLVGQLGYDPALAQSAYNLKAAKAKLDADGWITTKDGLRGKGNQRLAFSLTAADTPEYHRVTHELERQWRALGVKLDVQLQGAADFQNSVSSHSYEALLNGISIGVDPDVFVYWDSSQADIRSSNRLNLSEYKSAAADTALEAGRTRLDPTLRIVKYKPFLQAWQHDSPALGLYQPRLLYLTNGTLSGLDEGAINTPTDRFANVENWKIREARVTK